MTVIIKHRFGVKRIDFSLDGLVIWMIPRTDQSVKLMFSIVSVGFVVLTTNFDPDLLCQI